MLRRFGGQGRTSGEDGGIVVFFALLVPVLLMVFTLAVDIGNWFVHKRHLQMQADAAALAGGGYFGDCFSPDPAISGGANATIEAAAGDYAGNSSSVYNFQVGGGAPRVTTLFNSRTFADGRNDPDPPSTDPPCQSLTLDVKQTEADVPYILGPLVELVVPGSSTVVPSIDARARVQLRRATILRGSMPLAVPDINPRYVTATFVNEATGAELSACTGSSKLPGTSCAFSLTKGVASGGLNHWGGSAGSVTLPADANVGVRIGLGGQSGRCASADGTGGTGYVCYDYNTSSIGLAAIRSVGAGGTPRSRSRASGRRRTAPRAAAPSSRPRTSSRRRRPAESRCRR